MYDVLIVGAGPAGVAAANYAGARGVKVAVIEQSEVGGLIRLASVVSHYPGIDEDESGKSFSQKLKKQLEQNNAELIIDKICDWNKVDGGFELKGEKSTYSTRRLIFATGTRPKTPKFECSGELVIGQNAHEIARDKKDAEVFVLGGSDGACKEALYLSKSVKKVHIVQIQPSLITIAQFKDPILKSENIEVHLNSELKSVKMDGDEISEVEICDVDSKEIKKFEGEKYAICSYIGQDPNNELLIDRLKIDGGFVDEHIQTQIEGVFVCGDITKKEIRQISTAVYEGTLAGIKAVASLN